MVNCAIFLLVASSVAYFVNADNALLSALEGGRNEKLVVDANEGSQLVNGKLRGAQVFKPLKCEMKTYDNVQYFGTVTKFYLKVKSVDACVSACWQYNKAKGSSACRSISYLSSLNKCELMEDVLDVDNKAMFKYYARANDDAVYVIPISCGDEAPVSEAPKSASGRSVRAGGCGQTFVSPRSVTVNGSRPMQRIVGGIESRPHSLPWQVSLRQYDWHFCGGSLIRVDNSDQSDIVVTAAHCLYRPPQDLKIAVGAHWKSRTQPGEQRVQSSRFVLHPNYDPSRQTNDIAIIKLSQPVKFSNTIQPACLPAANEQVPDNTMGIVSGWGDLQEGGRNYPDALNQVSVPTVSSASCKNSYGGVDPKSMLCAGYTGGQRDSCQGDSGGPYVIPGRDGNYVLQGVVSFGEGCARANKPGVYARVSTYIDWINQQIRAFGTGSGNTGNTGNTGGGNLQCVDTISYCNDYIRDCKTAGWMERACAKSCKFC